MYFYSVTVILHNFLFFFFFVGVYCSIFRGKKSLKNHICLFIKLKFRILSANFKLLYIYSNRTFIWLWRLNMRVFVILSRI